MSVPSFDILGVCALALNVYKKCKNAPKEFQEVSRQVETLHKAIRHANNLVQLHEPVLGRDGIAPVQDLTKKLEDCRGDLEELERHLKKYKSLDLRAKTKSSQVLRFARHDILAVQAKLMRRNQDITLFLTTMNTGSLSRIEEGIDEILRRKPSILSGAASGDNDDDRWRVLREELLRSGITTQDIEGHKNQIVTYLRQLVQSAQRQGRETASGSRPASAVPIPASTHWRSASASGQSSPDQYVSPGTDASVLSATAGPYAVRPPSPVPSQASFQVSNPDVHRGGSLASRNTHLCRYPGCEYSFHGRGFQHPYDLEKHVKEVHGFTGSISLDQSERTGYRRAFAAGNGPRTYATSFAVEGPISSTLSRSYPAARPESIRSAWSPSISSVLWSKQPGSPAGQSLGSAHSYSYSPTPNGAASLPSPPLKRRPSASAEEYEHTVTDYYASGVPRRTSSVRRTTTNSTSSSSIVATPLLESGLRRYPSAPDLRQLHTAGEGPTSTAPPQGNPSDTPRSRYQNRGLHQRERTTNPQSRIQCLQDRLQQVKNDRDYYLRCRDFYKDLATRHMRDLPPLSDAATAKDEVRSV